MTTQPSLWFLVVPIVVLALLAVLVIVGIVQIVRNRGRVVWSIVLLLIIGGGAAGVYFLPRVLPMPTMPGGGAVAVQPTAATDDDGTAAPRATVQLPPGVTLDDLPADVRATIEAGGQPQPPAGFDTSQLPADARATLEAGGTPEPSDGGVGGLLGALFGGGGQAAAQDAPEAEATAEAEADDEDDTAQPSARATSTSASEPTATRTPTPLPTPTRVPYLYVTPQATATVEGVAALPQADGEALCAVTTNNNLNVRGGPSTDDAIVGSAPTGSVLTVVGLNADGSWLQVVGDGVEGWVSAPFTTAAQDCAAVLN